MAQQPSNQLATQMQQQMMQAQAAQTAQMQQQQQLQSQSQQQQQTAHGDQLQQTSGRSLDEPTSLARLRADDVRQWCEAFDKHELVDIIVGISDSNAQFQSFLGHALVTDIKWCKIRVTFPNDLNRNESLLNYKPREEDLFNVFKEFGAMNKIEIVLNPINNENNGIPYALITFRRYTDAQAAVSQGYHELSIHKTGGGSNDESSNGNGDETKNIRVSCCYAFENEESNEGGDADMNGNNGVGNTNGNGGNSNNGNNNSTNNLGQLQSQQQQQQRMSGGGRGGFVAQQLASFSQEGGPLVQRRLFVSSLSYNTTDGKLRETFSQYGDLDDCTIIHDKFTQRSKGYGFVIFKTVSGAQNALKQPDKYIDGRRTRCWLAAEGRNSNQNRF